MMATPTDAGTLAAVFAALYAAHQVADHWIQTQHQADHKADTGWRGHLACAAHVATYTLTAVVALAATLAVTGTALHLGWTAAGLTVSAVSHHIADRRTPLRRMADALGKSPAWLERGGGLYALDQSWHVGWLFVSALLTAT
ncbi:helix-turn-helix domain-containing protein [Dactylosporangium aurantiacum]